MAQPKASRPGNGMLAHYGITPKADGLMTWEWVDEQMSKARNYWVCTVRADGRPHAAPVWAVWLDGVLYFSSSRLSVKGQNVARDPRVTIHLESGDDTVIFEGRLLELTDLVIYARVRSIYNAKYAMEAMEETQDPNNVTWYLEPTSALSWLESDFPTTATRWEYGRDT
jgi:nitroimidazol reductase NimA-like FMN-containing flavoprotein (pyridoxamine 5'-phosphate oxidase superfamily)